MGALLGLLAGLGVVLIWQSGVNPNRTTTARFVARWRGQRAELLRQAGFGQLTPAHSIAVQIGFATIIGLAVTIIADSVSVAACFALFGAVAPIALLRGARRRRRQELREVWPEVVDNLASAVRAGMALPEALGALGTRGPAVLRPAFARFAADYRVSGQFAAGLDRLRAELADPVGDRVCESLRLAREVGGSDLGRLLRTLSAFLREDARTRAELETRQGWTINAARLAVAAPWLVLLLLATQRTTLAAYDSAIGRMLLVGGLLASVGAYWSMLRIGRLPAEPRVLR